MFTAYELLTTDFEQEYIITTNSAVYHLAEDSTDYPGFARSLCNLVYAHRDTRPGQLYANSASTMPIVVKEKPTNRRLCENCSKVASRLRW
jgi:hypothetical protein